MTDSNKDAASVGGEKLYLTSSGQYRAYLSHRLTGTVSWFNPQKGYGFIEAEGHPDAYLPLDVVQAFNLQTIYKETLVTCDVTIGPRSQVVQIYSIDDTHAIIPLQRPKPAPDVEYEVEGIVKFFHDDDRGFGFIETERGDIFVHVSGVRRSGLDTIHEGERYMCGVGSNDKGTIVLRLTAIEGEDYGSDNEDDDDYEMNEYAESGAR